MLPYSNHRFSPYELKELQPNQYRLRSAVVDNKLSRPTLITVRI
jgi:hypothetical protein